MLTSDVEPTGYSSLWPVQNTILYNFIASSKLSFPGIFSIKRRTFPLRVYKLRPLWIFLFSLNRVRVPPPMMTTTKSRYHDDKYRNSNKTRTSENKMYLSTKETAEFQFNWLDVHFFLNIYAILHFIYSLLDFLMLLFTRLPNINCQWCLKNFQNFNPENILSLSKYY